MESKLDINLRPAFHITGGEGWINDPNGLAVFKDRYHVFFQYYPYGVKWGPMHWGHVSSADLVKWERHPVALCPDKPYDADGCFSGSAIVWKDKLWLVYTGFVKGTDEKPQRQVQCLAASADGINFEKHGVIIDSDGLPDGYEPSDFRDPKVWRHNGAFWCVVAAKKTGGRGRVLLYRSDDLFKWDFVADVFGEDCAGEMTECPDYREEDGLMFVSVQFPDDRNLHKNVHASLWYKGRLDYATGKFVYEKSGIVDYGFDFYAAQTFCGENLMIGWLSMWDRTPVTESYGFSGMLTVPRQISFDESGLVQSPAVCLRQLAAAEVINEYRDEIAEGALKITAENLEEFSLKLRAKGSSYVSFSLSRGEWVFDRSKCSLKICGAETDADSVAGIRRMPYIKKKVNEIIVLIDKFSVEIFADGKAMSSLTVTGADAEGVELVVKSSRCSYVKYAVNSNN